MRYLTLIFFSILSLTALANSVGINGAPCQYQSIQQALAALPPAGGTIRVEKNALIIPELTELLIDRSIVIEASENNCLTASNQRTSLTAAAQGQSRFATISPEGNLTLRKIILKKGSAASGGQIFNQGALTLVDSVLRDGAANNGGCIYSAGNLSIHGRTKLINCRAEQNGGAIYFNGQSDPARQLRMEGNPVTVDTIRGGSILFEDNHANIGGALYISDYYEVSDEFPNSYKQNPLRNVVFYQNSAEFGGAVYASTSGLAFSNARFFENQAVNGGALYFNFSYLLVNSDYQYCNNGKFQCSLFFGNRAQKGGAVFLESNYSEIKRTVFDGNSVGFGPLDSGSAIYSAYAVEEFIDNSIFDENTGASTVEYLDGFPSFNYTTFVNQTQGVVFALDAPMVNSSRLIINRTLLSNINDSGLGVLGGFAFGHCNMGDKADFIDGNKNLSSQQTLTNWDYYPSPDAIDRCSRFSLLGTTDFYGQPRLSGIRTDVGAVEL